jgi:RecA-family ATPase
LVGNPGCGKTFVSLAIAGGITIGRPPFSEPCKPQNVLYLSNEDSPAILRGRFDAMGGDPARIWFETPEHAIALNDHSGIEGVIEKHDAVLVIVDTVTTHFGAKADFHKASDVSSVLSPLVAMAQRTGAAVLGLMHLSKAAQSHSLYRVQGSTAFAGSARSILVIGTDPSDATARVLTHLKSNGSAEGESRRFTISGDRGVAWGDVTALRAVDVLQSESTSEDRSELDRATEFLREALAGNSRDADEIKAEANEQQIKKRTLERAKALLKVKSRKKSFGGGWYWWLEGHGPEECQDRQEGRQPAL